MEVSGLHFIILNCGVGVKVKGNSRNMKLNFITNLVQLQSSNSSSKF